MVLPPLASHRRAHRQRVVPQGQAPKKLGVCATMMVDALIAIAPTLDRASTNHKHIEAFDRETYVLVRAYLEAHGDELRTVDLELAAFVCVTGSSAPRVNRRRRQGRPLAAIREARYEGPCN